MQFNFLKRLFHAGAAAPAQRPPDDRALPSLDALLQSARALLTNAGAPALAARLEIHWNPRMRSTAGVAFARKSRVTLNPRLVDFPGEIDRTLRHELAHLLAHERAGRRRISPHGAEWKQACHDLGLINERRTHDLPLPKTERKRRHFYRCQHCDLEIARVRPLRSGSACLRCCRAHSRGRYDPRFKLVRVTKPH